MKYLYISLSLLGAILFTACADLDIEPQGTITEEQKMDVLKKMPEKLAADVVGMFGIIGQQRIIFPTSSRADDIGYPGVCISQDRNGPDAVGFNIGYNWFGVSSEYSDRSDTYANPFIRYGLFYKQIKMANDLIASIPEDKKDDSTLKVYIAQAKAVRAFDYLCLAPYFQYKYKGNEDKPSVPIVDPKRGNDANNPRVPLKELYEYILENLNEAITDLDGYARKSKGEIDQKVAYGIRARAHLYMENWTAAAADAAKAMEGYTPYTREEVSTPAFYDANDHNYMWAIILKPANIKSSYNCWPGWVSPFGTQGYGSVGCWNMINSALYRKIPESDVRKGWWIDEKLESKNLEGLVWGDAKGNAIATLAIPNVKPAFAPYTNVKFGHFGAIDDNSGAGDWCIMRTEEMILIRAEAVAMAGDLAGGKKILEDFVKTHRDPNYSAQAANEKDFQDEVWLQRRIELWGEGFSTSDIMRLGKNFVRFSPQEKSNFPAAYKFNIAANDPWILLRFPQKETNNNPGIVQNTGGKKPSPNDGAELKDGVLFK